MKNRWFVLCLTLLLCPLILAQESDDMTQADALAAQWQHQAAADAYLALIGPDSSNYEALWKAGEQITEVANDLPKKEKDKKEACFEQAKTLCEKAIAVNPDGWEGHFRLSVALGRLALFRGGKEKINLSKAIKTSADRALELNPQADLAHHVLGRWHQNLANLGRLLRMAAKVMYGGAPPGSNEEAVAHFEKAIAINPNHIEHYLELAKTYKQMGKKELMKAPLEKAIALPNVEKNDAEFKKEAEKLLKKL